MLPRWAQRLLERHPGEPLLTPDNPLPPWLEAELRDVPLAYQLRGTSVPRHEHPYHLIDDIRRQPLLWQQVLRELKEELEGCADRLVHRRVRSIVLVGSGSALFGSILGAFLFEQLAGMRARAVESLEFVNYPAPWPRNSLLLAQSATGASAETLEAVRSARSRGMETLALVNTPSSPLERLADRTVTFPTDQQCGPDISVVTTRLIMLYLLALHLGLRRRRRQGWLRELRGQLDTLPEKLERFLEREEHAAEALAGRHAEHTAFLLVGGGANYFSALEGSLKIEEESCVLCKAYSPADYAHEALPLLGASTVTAVVAPPGRSYGRLRDVVRAAAAARSPTVGVVLEDDRDIAAVVEDVLRIGSPLDEVMMPPLATVAFQLLGYYLGVRRGVNPDTFSTDDMAHARAWLTLFPLGSH